MTREKKETRAAARKRREAWMAEVNQRWAAFVAQWVARPDLMALDPEPIEDLLTAAPEALRA